MEGKKYRALGQDCKAVSELMGVVLMISIVVLAFSSIAVTVFSDGGTMDPTHTPHTNLRENIDTSRDRVQIFHNGGEAIDLEDIRIILSVNETQAEFNMSDFEVHDPNGNTSSDSVFELGDYIEIDPSNKINIEHGDVVDFYFVHTESSQVIQKTKLWIKGKELPYWITPYTFFPDGTAYDSYTETWPDTALVDKVDGESTEDFTRSFIPKSGVIYENFSFGIDTKELDIPESTLFDNVTLKIVYKKHDKSAVMKLEIYNGSQWIMLDDDLPFYNTFKECDEELKPYPITSVKNTTELENLEVKISGDGNAADPSDKYLKIDFVGIHVEY